MWPKPKGRDILLLSVATWILILRLQSLGWIWSLHMADFASGPEVKVETVECQCCAVQSDSERLRRVRSHATKSHRE